ncbi:transposase [Sulfurovum sp. ST-21]|uniref:Transposase n=1 Tax=Sulfurovum indicum TaxID=2779528 RepID=A0A7M1S095_9BACT|nr:transposase [Sulfurovum indicum]QOR60950.1 transposase [Sulfurovum indicum]QOR60953.1 transposase [Sulfurovum indicum]
MPRKPRIELAGKYHIINRGVEQRKVFEEPADYEQFEELMCFYAKSFGITIHNYCLMSNHYHLLIEISRENLSKFMRQLNMNYSIYFNKKNRRTGHLWQGRYKSWYVTDEAYLYTLMCYIEQNPLKANIVKTLEAYPYSSYHYFLEKEIPECLKDSWVVEQYQDDKEAIEAFLTNPVDTSQLQELKRASSLIEAPNVDKRPKEEDLRELFQNITDIKQRNKVILQAIEQGYSQHMIAKVLGISQQAVYGVVKRSRR